jgi:hypothetical protein
VRLFADLINPLSSFEDNYRRHSHAFSTFCKSVLHARFFSARVSNFKETYVVLENDLPGSVEMLCLGSGPSLRRSAVALSQERFPQASNMLHPERPHTVTTLYTNRNDVIASFYK